MFKNAVVLTGGIATGKSTVANLFMLHGFLTIDADKIAHTLLDIYSDKIASLFGQEYVENGKVLRKKLGNLIFNDIDEKKKLEHFIHPLIKEEIQKEASLFESKNKPYLIDIPLFFENKNYDIAKSIVVYTPKEIQIQRLQKRDNCDEVTALARINNQMDIEEKKALATYVIDNSENLKHLTNEVERVKNEILKI
ncbi:MAG: dephospho-CoA kinase [Arcobacteraceae bacterium]|jgi:dephospho-CoA kinase|nr:dephospho-CoA kinase [Arcobacteraceae bacterium]